MSCSNVTFVPTVANPAVGVFAEVIPADDARSFVQIQNKGEDAVYIGFNSAATESTSIKLEAGAFYEPISKVPNNALWLSTVTGAPATSQVLVLTSAISAITNY